MPVGFVFLLYTNSLVPLCCFYFSHSSEIIADLKIIEIIADLKTQLIIGFLFSTFFIAFRGSFLPFLTCNFLTLSYPIVPSVIRLFSDYW